LVTVSQNFEREKEFIPRIMPLKAIKISERIYKKLLDSKKDEESISEFLERLLNIKEQSKDINKSFGIWKDLPTEYFEIIKSDIKEIREGINQRFSSS